MNKYLSIFLLISFSFFQVVAQGVETWVEGKGKRSAQDIEIDSKGNVWMVVNNNLSRWEDDGTGSGKVTSLGNKKNKIIINKANGDLSMVENGRVVILDPNKLKFLTGIVSNIAIDQNDRLWAVTSNNNLYQKVDDIWHKKTGQLVDIAIGIKGQMWGLSKQRVGAHYPVLRFVDNGWQETGAVAFVGGIAVDAKGEAWIIHDPKTKGARHYKVSHSSGKQWLETTDIYLANSITSNQQGEIWIAGRDSKFKRYTTLFQWQEQQWIPSMNVPVEGKFALSSKNNPIFLQFHVLDEQIIQLPRTQGLTQTANLSITNFTIDQENRVWVIRDRRRRDRAPEILVLKNNRFETGVETKKFWQVDQNKLQPSDWPSDIAIDSNNKIWILAKSQIYFRENDQWKKIDDRYYIDLVSSSKGEIFAIENTKALSTPDPYNKRYTYGRAVYQVKKNKMVKIADFNGAIQKLAIEEDGTLWILSHSRTNFQELAVYRQEKAEWINVALPEGLLPLRNFANGADGTLWLAARLKADRLILKWDGTQWQQKYDRTRADIISGDKNGHYMGLVSGGFISGAPVKSSNKSKQKQLKKKIAATAEAPAKTAPAKTKLPVKKKQSVIPKTQNITAKLKGCWKWSNGANIQIKKNGTVVNGAIKGQWSKNSKSQSNDNSEAVYSIVWPSFLDFIKLTNDGKSFAGTNIFGLPISGERQSSPSNSIVGKWKWFNGVIVDIQKNETVNAGTLNGRWTKQKDNYIIEWPVVDEIIISLDGKKLTGKNQFGEFSASRETCALKPTEAN